MLIKDIDLNIIADILKELPEGLEVTSQIHDYAGDEALKEIINYIRDNKNYLLIDD